MHKYSKGDTVLIRGTVDLRVGNEQDGPSYLIKLHQSSFVAPESSVVSKVPSSPDEVAVCPYCKEVPSIYEDETKKVGVMCNNPDCEVHPSLKPQSTRELAVVKWNRCVNS